MSNTADLDATEAELRRLIVHHGLRLLGAVVSPPNVLFDPETPLGTHFEVIVESRPRFVTLRLLQTGVE